jgi:hypothetical protein
LCSDEPIVVRAINIHYWPSLALAWSDRLLLAWCLDLLVRLTQLTGA